jgi:hypothetical protein
MCTARYEANCPINPSKISQLYYGFHGFSLGSAASQIFPTLLVSDSATTAVNISFRSNTASARSNLLSALHNHTTLHYTVPYLTVCTPHPHNFTLHSALTYCLHSTTTQLYTSQCLTLLSALHNHTTLHYTVPYLTSNLTFREGRADTIWEFYSSAFCQFVTKVSCLSLFAFCVPPSNFRS